MDELNEAQAPQGQGDLADLVDIGNQSLDAIAAQQQYAEEPQGDVILKSLSMMASTKRLTKAT